jgi:hypothetical protein
MVDVAFAASAYTVALVPFERQQFAAAPAPILWLSFDAARPARKHRSVNAPNDFAIETLG